MRFLAMAIDLVALALFMAMLAAWSIILIDLTRF